MKALRTVVSGKNREVTISRDGPTVVIGGRINPTGRKDLTQALHSGDMQFLIDEAVKQVKAGADVIDINVGAAGINEDEVLPNAVAAITSVIDTPISIDSNSPSALEAALEACPGKPIINSVNGKEEGLSNILPLVASKKAAVIGLTLDENGIPNEPEKRFAIAEKIVNQAVKAGIAHEDVIIDPLALTIGTDQRSALITLETIRLIVERLGLNINLGISNISFGLPGRDVINKSFLSIALAFGATCLIVDPAKAKEEILALDLLLNKDKYCKRYLSFQKNKRLKV